MIRKILHSIFIRVIPELNILKKNISWSEYEDYKFDCNIDPTAKVFSPYKLIKVSLDENSYLNCNSQASNLVVGKYTSIGPNFFCGWGIHPINGISTAPSFYSVGKPGLKLCSTPKIEEHKTTMIGNDVFIGSNVVVLDGITIGDGAVIGAGSVVSKDIPPYAVAVGSPIRVIKYRFTKEQIDSLSRIKWWNFDAEKIKDVEQMFFDVDGFIKKYDI